MIQNLSTSPITATLIRGDGIGPEVVDATVLVLQALNAPILWDIQKAGMEAMDEFGDPLPSKTLDSIKKNKLALKGPLTTPVGGGFRSINVSLRKEFSLYANVRPARTWIPGGRFDDIDLVVVRENTEGLYVGFEHFIPIDNDPHAVAEATGIMTRSGCRRIAKYAFEYAIENKRKKVTIVHKANILKALTGLFLETALEEGKAYEGRIQIEERIVDNTAMQLVIDPQQFDVILTTNMFGDILSDEIAGLVGGLGLAPGANIGRDAAIFEAVHGTAPDIAGKGIANPTSVMLASAMLLDHIGCQSLATQLRNAISHVLIEGSHKTRDLKGTASTMQYTQALIDYIQQNPL